LQRPALLDMQLEVAMMRSLVPPRLGDALGVAPNLANRIGAPQPVPHLVEIRRREVAGDNAAAGEAAAKGKALLVRPDHHLEGMARSHPRGGERIEGAQSQKRTQVAVEIATARHGVDVGAEQDRWEGRLGAAPPPQEVARS